MLPSLIGAENKLSHKTSWSPLSNKRRSYLTSNSKSFAFFPRPKLIRRRKRGRSLTEKIIQEESDFNSVLCLCYIMRCLMLLSLWMIMISIIGGEHISDLVSKVSKQFIDCFEDFPSTQSYLPQGVIHHHNSERIYPSLNLFDYDESMRFPVFPKEHFPLGFYRSDMPQLGFNASTRAWKNFEDLIRNSGGRIRLESGFDLRQAQPLQREISGTIVYNFLLDEMKRQIEQRNSNYFRNRIILIKSNSRILNNRGSFFDRGTHFILDGHHTSYTANLCTNASKTKLRMGNLFKGSKMCGKAFNPKQDILVIEGIDVFKVRLLALQSGAKTGHGMVFQSTTTTTTTAADSQKYM